MKTPGSKNEEEIKNTCDIAYGGLGIRHVQTAVLCTASFLTHLLRYNLSVAIVAMVDVRNNTDNALSDTPTYDWDEEEQGYLLASFFVGYWIMQIPSGYVSEKFGGHWLLCCGTLTSALLTVLFPQCVIYGGLILACVNRGLQGISQAVIYPSIFNLLGVWAPPAERSRLTSVSLSDVVGCTELLLTSELCFPDFNVTKSIPEVWQWPQLAWFGVAQLLGTVVSTPVSGFLCQNLGWPYVFYILGGSSTALGLIMVFLGADSPEKHRMISNAEKDYIQSSLGGAKEKLQVPWKQVLTYIPYYASVICYALRGAVFSTFQTKTPAFLGTVLGFDIAQNGVLSALPSLVSWILNFAYAGVCDLAISRGWLRTTAARKLLNSIAYYGSAVFIVLLAHANDTAMSVIYLVLAIGIQSGTFVGVTSTFVDMTPNFSGSIFSVANFVSSGLGQCGSPLVGKIVTTKGSAEQWRTVFYLCAALMVFGNTVYIICGNSETQWWNWPEKYKSKKDYEDKKEIAENEQKAEC